VLAGDPRRSYFPKERFRQLAEYSVPVTKRHLLEDADIKRTLTCGGSKRLDKAAHVIREAR
jgi:predicted nicotinamide N-methyase